MRVLDYPKALLAGLLAALAPLLLHSPDAAAQATYSLVPIRPFFSPSAINNHGQVSGLTFNEQGLGQGAVWTRGGAPPIAILGTAYDTANDINDAGQVAGSHRFTPEAARAAVFDGGLIRDPGTLGGAAGSAFAINESGQATGHAETAAGRKRAFLHDGGAMRDLGSLGGWRSFGYGINDAGEIAGFACRPHPVEQSGLDCAGVVLIPVPEPAPWMLWSGAIVLAAARACSHRRGTASCWQASGVSRSPPAAATRPA